MDDAVEAERCSILLAGAAQVDVLRRLLRADAASLLSLLVGGDVVGDRLPPLEGFELLGVAPALLLLAHALF